jgi:hypothetical protein
MGMFRQTYVIFSNNATFGLKWVVRSEYVDFST